MRFKCDKAIHRDMAIFVVIFYGFQASMTFPCFDDLPLVSQFDFRCPLFNKTIQYSCNLAVSFLQSSDVHIEAR